MDEDLSDLLECPNCSMFVTTDSARCRFCDALVLSSYILTKKIRPGAPSTTCTLRGATRV